MSRFKFSARRIFAEGQGAAVIRFFPRDTKNSNTILKKAVLDVGPVVRLRYRELLWKLMQEGFCSSFETS